MRITLGFTPTMIRAQNGGTERIVYRPAPVLTVYAPALKGAPIAAPGTAAGGITYIPLPARTSQPSQPAPPSGVRMSNASVAAGAGATGGGGASASDEAETTAPKSSLTPLLLALAAAYFTL